MAIVTCNHIVFVKVVHIIFLSFYREAPEILSYKDVLFAFPYYFILKSLLSFNYLSQITFSQCKQFSQLAKDGINNLGLKARQSFLFKAF